MLELEPAPPGAKPRLGHKVKGEFTTRGALDHENYAHFLSGEMNVANIDPTTGSHDKLADWAYSDESDLMLEVSGLIEEAMHEMLEHAGVVVETVDEGQLYIPAEISSELAVLAAELGKDHTVTVVTEQDKMLNARQLQI
jgi:hypothetical protein